MYIDIAVGLIIGFGVSMVTGEGYFPLMLFGVFVTLAPDIDFIVWLIRHKWKVDQFAHEHRDLLHRPILFGLGGGVLIGLVHPVYGVVWCIGVTAHFIHDTFDGGWGIQWFHPFSSRYYTLASYSPKRSFRDKAEQRAVAAVHGNPHWLEEGYFKWNTKLMAEYAVLALAILVILFWLLRNR